MSAYGTFFLLRDPKGLAVNTVGAAHTRSRQGCRENLLHPYTQSVVAPTCKGCCRYAVASQALTGFQLRPLRLVLLPPRRWSDEVVHFTLDALNDPTLTVGVGG